jgi:hypothetical protein
VIITFAIQIKSHIKYFKNMKTIEAIVFSFDNNETFKFLSLKAISLIYICLSHFLTMKIAFQQYENYRSHFFILKRNEKSVQDNN